MARRKETIPQVDFGFGATRPESVEREDTPLVQEGVKEALNTVGLTTGAIEGRPGLLHIAETTSLYGVEVDLGGGRVYDLHIVEDGVIIYGPDGSTVASFLSNTWDDLASKFGADDFDPYAFWVLPDPDTSSILLGASAYPTHALSVDGAGSWTFGLLNYATSLAGAVLQPYWSYFPNVSITPSGRSGAITVTASGSIWTPAYEGLRIRYQGREILLGTVVSGTVINATVVEELPPTYDFTVGSASGFQMGDAVEHKTLGGQGIIKGIAGSVLTVLATSLWDGFTNSGDLIGPNANQAISAQSTVSPASTFQWDVQMASSVHGYPGWGAKHKGRAYLCRYPRAPNAFAVSVAGRVDDFTAGIDDADGFVETMGANMGGDLLYILSAEDLLFFTTRGLYYQSTRGGEDVTSRNIGPIPFSQMGCSAVIPVAVDDGAIFVDAVGQQVYAAVLAGDYYKSWATQHITQYHNHLVDSPIFLGATKAGSDRPESFLFVVNEGGDVAVCQWDRAQNKIGWRPWDTQGAFKSIYQAFGDLWAVVDRSEGSYTGQFRERFQTGVYMDSVAALFVSSDNRNGKAGEAYFGTLTKTASHLSGLDIVAYFEQWDLGSPPMDESGQLRNPYGDAYEFPDYEGFAQIGLPFTIRITPWPRRSVSTQRGTREVKRSIKTFITVQDTLAFTYQGYTFGGYRVGDDVSVPPVLRSEEYSAIVGGRSAFEERPIIVDRPGPFRLLKLKHRVTV